MNDIYGTYHNSNHLNINHETTVSTQLDQLELDEQDNKLIKRIGYACNIPLTVGSVLNLTPEAFGAMPSIGPAYVTRLIKFQEKLKTLIDPTDSSTQSHNSVSEISDVIINKLVDLWADADSIHGTLQSTENQLKQRLSQIITNPNQCVSTDQTSSEGLSNSELLSDFIHSLTQIKSPIEQLTTEIRNIGSLEDKRSELSKIEYSELHAQNVDSQEIIKTLSNEIEVLKKTSGNFESCHPDGSNHDKNRLFALPNIVARRDEAVTDGLIRFNKTCPYCGEPLFDTHDRDKYQVDHFIPIVKGGQDVPWNLLPVCAKCNLEKQGRWPSEYLSQDIIDACKQHLAEIRDSMVGETQQQIESFQLAKGMIKEALEKGEFLAIHKYQRILNRLGDIFEVKLPMLPTDGADSIKNRAAVITAILDMAKSNNASQGLAKRNGDIFALSNGIHKYLATHLKTKFKPIPKNNMIGNYLLHLSGLSSSDAMRSWVLPEASHMGRRRWHQIEWQVIIEHAEQLGIKCDPEKHN